MSFRRFVCSMAVVAAAGVSIPIAAERVTLIMTDEPIVMPADGTLML